MLHSRGQLLSDVAAFVKGDAAQLFEIGIEREHRVLAKIPALGNPKVKTMRRVGVGRRALRVVHADRAAAERGNTWIAPGSGGTAIPGGDHREIAAALDLQLCAQSVRRKPLLKRFRGYAGAVEKNRALALIEQEIEKDFSLWREQCRIKRCVGRELANIVGNQALQERARFWSADGEDSAIVENGSHKREVNLSRKSSSADVAR